MSEAVRDAVNEAFEIVAGTPITITANEEKTSNIPGHLCYTIEIPDAEYKVDARNAFELLSEVKEARDFWEAWQKVGEEVEKPRIPKAPESVVYPFDPGRTLSERARRNVIREAYAIAESCPAMIVEELKDGWFIGFEDNDYHAEARGAVDLLREVKEARDFWEALQKLEKKEQAVRLEAEVEVEVDDEECIRDEDGIIHVHRLDQSTKRLLINFIENLTIGEAMCTLTESNVYPHIALGELYGIDIQLRESLEAERKP